MNFDLLILPYPDAYYIRVESPVGQATSYFTLPFTQGELDRFAWQPDVNYRHIRVVTPSETGGKPLDPQEFGTRLFDAVFANEVHTCLRLSLDKAHRQEKHLRVRLRLNEVPELASLPWEYLYDSTFDQFFVLLNQVSLMRYLELPKPVDPLLVELPLRILVVISSPSSAEQLDIEQEWNHLQQAMRPLVEQGKVVIDRLNRATHHELQRQLRRNNYHIFHFIGHGWFDEQKEIMGLLFEDENGNEWPLTAKQLGVLLQGHPTLRFAFLNACEGARSLSSLAFGGTAQYLVRQNLPAVLAMQFPVTDKAAIGLAQEFYQALADNYPVDRAITEARKAIYLTGSIAEWATPVLFMRTQDGRLFQMEKIETPQPLSNTGISVKTNGGAYIGGNIVTDGGDFAGRDIVKQYFLPDKPLPVPFPAHIPIVNNFTGRQELMTEIESLLTNSNTHQIIGLCGMAGVGKTTLALHIAYRLKDVFPDGILWADLETSTPEKELESFARAFGWSEVIAKELDLPSKAKFVLNILAGKRILVVINDAKKSDDIQLLAPFGISNRTLITTRNRNIFNSFDADVVNVTPWSREDAISYLKESVGVHRIDNEPEATQRVMQRVGCLPLALSVIAGYLNISKEITLAKYDQFLQETESRQDYLADWDSDKRDIYKIFAISYESLSGELQQLFVSLSIFDGPDFSSDAVAVVLKIPHSKLFRNLSQLCALSLLNVGLGERDSLIVLKVEDKVRYRLHPLLKIFANDLFAQDELIRLRLATYYADFADRHKEPSAYPTLDLDWQNIVSSLHWAYEHHEWSLLVQGVSGLTQIYLGQIGYLDTRGHWGEARKMLDWVLEQVANLNDIDRARIQIAAGGFAVREARYDVARKYLKDSLILLEKAPFSPQVLFLKLCMIDFEAQSLLQTNRNDAIELLNQGIQESTAFDDQHITYQAGHLYIQLSSMLARIGKSKDALNAAEAGLAMLPEYLTSSYVAGMINKGMAYQQLGQYEKSIETFNQGIPLAEQLGDVRRLAALWSNIGRSEWESGAYQVAVAHQEYSLKIYRFIGDAYYECGASLNLGADYLYLGEVVKAQEHFDRTIHLCEQHGFWDVEAMLYSNLSDLYIYKQQLTEATAALVHSLQLTNKLAMDFLRPTVIRKQAQVALAEYRFQEGLALIDQALQLVVETDDIVEKEISLKVKDSLLIAASIPL